MHSTFIVLRLAYGFHKDFILKLFYGISVSSVIQEKQFLVSSKKCALNTIKLPRVLAQELCGYRNDPKFFGLIYLGKQCRPRSDCS